MDIVYTRAHKIAREMYKLFLKYKNKHNSDGSEVSGNPIREVFVAMWVMIFHVKGIQEVL